VFSFFDKIFRLYKSVDTTDAVVPLVQEFGNYIRVGTRRTKKIYI
jgi:hypothetical protein